MSDADLTPPQPIEITSLTCGGGVLGLTFCPGMRTDDQHTFRHGGKVHRRNLDKDLATIREWGATAVVTLLEDFEFRRLGVHDLGSRVVALGMQWFHLPIADQSTPSSDFEQLWDEHGREIRRLLENGSRVLIHCRHGHGRTGTLAARILIEFGDTADAAIDKVRAERPKSIGVLAQEEHVRAFVQRVGTGSKTSAAADDQATMTTKSGSSKPESEEEEELSMMEEWLQRLEAEGRGDSQFARALRNAINSPGNNSYAVVTGVTGGAWPDNRKNASSEAEPKKDE